MRLTLLVLALGACLVGCRCDSDSNTDAGTGGGSATGGGTGVGGGTSTGGGAGTGGGSSTGGGTGTGGGGSTGGGTATGGGSSAGGGSATGGGGGGVGSQAVEPVYTAAGPLWNLWVVNDGTTIHTGSGAACNFTQAPTKRDACLHAGELRQFRTSALSSCAGVVAFDSEAAFDWVCEVSGGGIVVRSTGLKPTVGLQRLIDFGATPVGFKSMSVSVRTTGAAVITSDSSVWWNNLLVPVTASGIPVSAASNPVFFTGQSFTGSINLQIPGSSFVTAPGTTFTGPTPTANRLIDVGPSARGPVWVEATIDGAGSTTALIFNNAPFSRVRNLTVRNTSGRALSLGTCVGCDAHNLRFEDVRSAVDIGGSYSSLSEVMVTRAGINVSAVVIGAANSVDQRARGITVLDSHDGVFIANHFVDVRHVLVANNAAAGFVVADNINAHGIRGHDIRSLHNGNGIIARGSRNVWTDLFSIGNRNGGIGGPNDDDILVGLLAAANQTDGIGNGNLGSPGSTLWKDMTSADNGANGFIVNRTGHTIDNALLANNALTSNFGFYVNAASGLRVWNLAVHHNGSSAYRDINVAGNPFPNDPNAFFGKLQVTDPSQSCNYHSAPFGPGGITNLCANANSTLADGGFVASSAMLSGSGLPWWTFAGRVRPDDALNGSDDAGAALISSITDWSSFENPFRGWGKAVNIGPDFQTLPYDGGYAYYGWPGLTIRGACVNAGESCEVFDYSLRGTAPSDAGTGAGGAADVYARNKLSFPSSADDVVTHVFRGAASQSQANCSEIPGANWNSAAANCSVTFLQRARELVEDGIGNDNGLCESNEVCVGHRNFGAYQGHGPYLDAGVLSNGVLSGVRLVEYQFNGR